MKGKNYHALFGKDKFKKIKDSHTLIVGAGGIGCELLKNMASVGFGHIDIIDLDTIDVSNLNRQFLFHKEHVGQSKASVAKEASMILNKDIHVVAHHGNVKHPEYGINFFRKFDVVINALDNLDARRHVNRMCVLADVPLVDAGTSGLKGNVDVIIPHVTECYACRAKETPKVLPVCTIRSVPSKPDHCIAWGKALFQRMFGEVDDTNVLSDVTMTNMYDAEWATRPGELGITILDKLFTDDIRVACESVENDMMWTQGAPTPMYIPRAADIKAVTLENMDDTLVLTTEGAIEVFNASFSRLYQATHDQTGKKHTPIEFDKDDILCMAFVSSVATLRMTVYHINAVSPFTIRSVAGSIVPAVCTTNSAVAGITVHRTALIITEGRPTSNTDPAARSSYVTFNATRAVSAPFPDPPSKTCVVCARKATQLTVVEGKTTFGEIYDLLKREIKSDELTVENAGNVLWDVEDGGVDRNAIYSEVGIMDSHVINVIDDVDGVEYAFLTIVHHTGPLEIVGPLFPTAVVEEPETLEGKRPVGDDDVLGDDSDLEECSDAESLISLDG